MAKKIENTSILPNFNTEYFSTSKLILEGSYAFVLFLKWIYILTNKWNLQNEHFWRDTYVEIDKNMLLDVKIYNSLIQKRKM